MEPKFDSLVCDRLISRGPGLGTPGVPGWGPVPRCVFVVVRRSPGLCGVAMRAATRCACPRSRPRRPACAPRRTEAIRHGQGWLATGGGTGTSHSHAGCCREVPSSTGTGRADSGYRRETTNERAERDARSGPERSGRGRAGGLERAEVGGALRPATSLPSPKQSSPHPSCECRHCASRPGA
jgi:hypothetical protein